MYTVWFGLQGSELRVVGCGYRFKGLRLRAWGLVGFDCRV